MDNIISCHFMGGLGNQMFQAAHSYAQSLKHNRPSLFKPISETGRQGNVTSHYVNNIFSKLNFVDTIENTQVVYEGEWYYKELNPLENNTIFYGYYQSNKNFLGYDDKIIDLFSPNNDFIEQMFIKYPELKSENTISVHIRRGDSFSAQNVHPIITESYIDKCLTEFGEYSYLFCFSDDKEWVKENLKYDNIIFVDGLLDYEEMWLMSLCKNNIIPNSTFSWWGAFLNKNKNKKIYVPSIWFGPDGPQNWVDIYPPNWIIINVNNENGWLV